jgi:hypothetical protein
MTEKEGRIFRKRLRPKYSDLKLAEIYRSPHRVKPEWEDHRLRIVQTLELTRRFIDSKDRIVADLSCGDGYILKHVNNVTKHFGDYAPGYQYTGPIEKTIHEIPEVDVFFLCETLEHLDDPDLVLRLIRNKAYKLILSTPLDESTDENPEHYWGWNKRAVKMMLKDAGWLPALYDETLPPKGYRFQIWGCR